MRSVPENATGIRKLRQIHRLSIDAGSPLSHRGAPHRPDGAGQQRQCAAERRRHLVDHPSAVSVTGNATLRLSTRQLAQSAVAMPIIRRSAPSGQAPRSAFDLSAHVTPRRLGVDENPVETEADGVDHDVSGRRQLR